MTDPSWLFRSGKEQQIHAAARHRRRRGSLSENHDVTIQPVMNRRHQPFEQSANRFQQLSRIRSKRTGQHSRFMVDDQIELSQR